jgi:hypothetical protein
MGKPAPMDEKTRKAVDTIRLRVNEMQSTTDRLCSQLNMTAAARAAADKAYKKVICGKKMLVFQRHSDEERAYLRMMLRLALATEQSLASKADEVAKYLGANYGFEWVNSEATATVREEANAMILSVGDSSYGATGTAAAFAYARCHYKGLRFAEVGDYGRTYALASRLQSNGEFNNRHDDWRKALGMDKLATRRDALLGRQEQGAG